MPWGPVSSLIAMGAAVALIFLSIIVGTVITSALGHDTLPEDRGDAFDKAAEVVAYADRRLAAASRGEALPAPPQVVGDLVAARVFYIVAGLSTLGMAVVAWAASRRSPTTFVGLVGLGRFRGRWLWQGVLLTLGAYVGVIAYSRLATALGIDILIPDSQTPFTAIRDDAAFVLFGILAVIAAPIGEEVLFRGVVFGGLSRWGFWPAAIPSGFLFALSHVDPGTYLPFTAIGILFAWLFWRNRSLWPNIVCHACFNGLSFLFLAMSR